METLFNVSHYYLDELICKNKTDSKLTMLKNNI